MLTLGALPHRLSFSWSCRVRNVSHSQKPSKQAPGRSPTSVTSNIRKATLLPSQSQASTPLNYAQSSEPSTTSASPSPPKHSLLAELFPGEAQKHAACKPPKNETNAKVPALPLPAVEELLKGFKGDLPSDRSHSRHTTRAASSDVYKHREIAVLVLQAASRSLVESDFRRIAPKGKHIGEWIGPGDILKVFPARDPVTFEQAEHYFLVFASPAYARAYQSHVLRLYRTARQHTPTSIESPLPLQRGTTIDGKDSYAMLQDFTLCPPSQRIQLKYLIANSSQGMKRLLDQGGYLGLPDGTDRAGRAVLFWVDGYQPTSRELNTIIASDGRDRGMAWNVLVAKLDTSPVPADLGEDIDSSEISETLETSPRRRAFQRWVLTFSSESEARRFIRAWHRKHLASLRHDEPRIVHTEFLW